MLTARVIPCLDVKNGRVVKGVRFQGLRDQGSPLELALRYEAQGADELVLLDVSATREARHASLETILQVRSALTIPLTVGGGVRSRADAEQLLEHGADKVGVNTAAVESPPLLTDLSSRFGRQCVVLALDAATCAPGQATTATDSGWEVVTHSGRQRTGIDAIAWAREAEARGVGEILLTSFDRDGTRSGYDTDLLRAVSESVRVPVIASGGADTIAHLAAALDAGASAVLAASIFHQRDTDVAAVKRGLRARGVEVRL